MDIKTGFIALSFLLSSYSLYISYRKEKNIDKVNKIEYLKLLSSAVRKIAYEDSIEEKNLKYGEIRDDLNYCSCFGCDDSEDFLADVDDKISLVVNVLNNGDFKKYHSEVISYILNFKKKFD